MPVLTISGTMGSAAREVGQAAARLLGIDLVDQQLLVQAAQKAGVPFGAMAEHDERCDGLGERLSGILRSFLEKSAASSADPLTGAVGLEGMLSRSYADLAVENEDTSLTDRRYIQTITAVVQDLSARGDIAILGRGSQMILADRPEVLHVHCVAPKAVRIPRVAERDGISAEAATHKVGEMDKALIAFHRKFWKVEFSDPKLYDITIDTSRLPIAMAAGIVATAARAKTAGGFE